MPDAPGALNASLYGRPVKVKTAMKTDLFTLPKTHEFLTRDAWGAVSPCKGR